MLSRRGGICCLAFVWLWLASEVLAVTSANSASVQADADCVILLHGLARTSSSMTSMASALRLQGYRVVNHDYPSRHHPIDTLVGKSIEPALEECRRARPLPPARIHVVTHSLGGILLRRYLEQQSVGDLGRVVMLAPPNQGSEVVDVLRDVPGFSALNGPAGLQLGTDSASLPRQLGPLRAETAVIAGTRSINLILSNYLPNPDDGKVSVASTRVANMCAFLALPVSHPFIMKDEQVITEVIHYLATGRLLSADAEYPGCTYTDATG